MQERWTLILVGLAGLFLAVGWVGETFIGLPPQIALVFYLLAYLAGGYDVAKHAIPGLLRGKFDTDVLMLAAAVGAAVLGEWAEGAFLLFLFSLGHAGEHYALDRARNAVNALGELMPKTARVRRGDELVETPVESLQLSEVVVVRPGDRIPVDGEVVQGSSADQSPITGESVPVDKQPGDGVFAGSVNQTAALESESFYRGMLLLAAASPCALAIGTPAAVLAGIAQAARHGVLVKGGVHLENLGRLQVMAFDKTGTLTEGRFQVTDVVPLNGVSADELLQVAAAVEQHSNHPLAEAVVQAAQMRKLDLPAAAGLENIAGKGVRSQIDGQPVMIGSLRLFDEAVTQPRDEAVAQAVARLTDAGKSTMVVSRNGAFLGVLGLADQPRPNVKQTLQRLLDLGVKRLVMLTGDNPAVAQRIAAEVGVTDVRANLLPEDKLTAIQALEREHGAIAMAGDGVNDAPALATATVGIAMGGAGTAVALETADVALMADDLGRLPFAVGLSRASRTVILQNLAVSLGVIALLILTSVLGLVQLSGTVVVHEGSTVVVVLNALRLLAYTAK